MILHAFSLSYYSLRISDLIQKELIMQQIFGVMWTHINCRKIIFTSKKLKLCFASFFLYLTPSFHISFSGNIFLEHVFVLLNTVLLSAFVCVWVFVFCTSACVCRIICVRLCIFVKDLFWKGVQSFTWQHWKLTIKPLPRI